jgi:hypothetical protein
MHDPQNIWQTQTTERFKMSANELRVKAQEHQKRARLKAQVSIIGGFIVFVFFAWNFSTAHEVVPRAGLGLISLWGLYFAYQAYKRIWRPGRLTPDTALDATLESYRSELEKQGDYARHIWWKSGHPFCFLGLALVVVPGLIQSTGHPGRLMNFVPIFVLLALWFPAFFFIRRRDRQKLQREMEELRAFEAANQA